VEAARAAEAAAEAPEVGAAAAKATRSAGSAKVAEAESSPIPGFGPGVCAMAEVNERAKPAKRTGTAETLCIKTPLSLPEMAKAPRNRV
jgi:hypothetical protein